MVSGAMMAVCVVSSVSRVTASAVTVSVTVVAAATLRVTGMLSVRPASIMTPVTFFAPKPEAATVNS